MGQDCKVTDEIQKEFTKIEPGLKKTLVETINENTLFSPIIQRINDVSQRLNPQALLDRQTRHNITEWKTIYHPGTRETENFENTNTNNIDYLRKAIQARHAAFRNGSNFSRSCDANTDATINSYIDNEKTDLNKLQNYMDAHLKSYRSLDQYRASLSALKNGKVKELQAITRKIDTYKQNLFIDNRKDSYQQKNLTFYQAIHFYIMIVYYGLFVLYFILSDFIKGEQYKNRYLVLGLLGLLVMPFILKYILFYMHYAYVYFMEINNLKDDPISYPHIVDD